MAYTISKRKAQEVRRLNKLLQNKESRIRSKVPGASGIYGRGKFDYQTVSEFTNTREVNSYIKSVNNALDRNKYRYVSTGNADIPFLPRAVEKTFKRHQQDVNKAIANLNSTIQNVSDEVIMQSTGMKMSQYKRIQARVEGGVKAGISGFGADFIKNSTSPKFLRQKMINQSTKKVNELEFEQKKMERYQKLYARNLKEYFADDSGKTTRQGNKLAKAIRKMDVERFSNLFYRELVPSMDDWWESERNLRMTSETALAQKIESALESDVQSNISYKANERHVPKSYKRTQKDLMKALKDTSDSIW